MSRLPEASFSAPTVAPRAALRVRRSRWWPLVAYGVLVCLSAVALQPAHAGQVSWSVGFSAPGVVVGVAQQPPIYPPAAFAPPPVYAPAVVQAPAVVYGPAVVYAPPRVVYSPPPQVVYRPPFVVRSWDDDRYRHHHGHHHHHRDWDGDGRRFGGY